MSWIGKLASAVGNIVTPLAKEGSRSLVMSTFEEFLIQREEHIKVVLGVEDSRTVIRDLRKLFRDFVDGVKTEIVYEDEEEEEEEVPRAYQPRPAAPPPRQQQSFWAGPGRDPWSD